MSYAIARWSVTPDTWEHDVQLAEIKSLIKDGTSVYTFKDKELINLNTSSPTEDDFKSYGIDNFDELTTPTTEIILPMEGGEVVGDGKVYRKIIDVDRLRVSKMEVK